MASRHRNANKIFKALADDNRLEFLSSLMNGAKCGCELIDALGIGQSTLSHHMRILCDAGLVDACKEGKWMHYSLSAEGSALARETLQQYTLSSEQASDYQKCDSCCK